MLAQIPQVNSSREPGRDAGVCSTLGLQRGWKKAAVPEKPPVCLWELPAGLVEATTLEVGPDSISLAHKWYLLISDTGTNSRTPRSLLDALFLVPATVSRM